MFKKALGLVLIDSYSFGRIIIDGKTYTSDIIIYHDKVDDSWWRKSGHLLQKEDLRHMIQYNPDILIIGTGAYGLMKVQDKIKQFLESKGIKMIAEVTKDACGTYNELHGERKVVAAVNLTC